MARGPDCGRGDLRAFGRHRLDRDIEVVDPSKAETEQTASRPIVVWASPSDLAERASSSTRLTRTNLLEAFFWKFSDRWPIRAGGSSSGWPRRWRGPPSWWLVLEESSRANGFRALHPLRPRRPTQLRPRPPPQDSSRRITLTFWPGLSLHPRR